MKSVIQRVTHASVKVDGEIKGEIKNGLLILAGFCDEDTDEDLEYCAQKIVKLRIFNDENNVMNLSVEETGGEILIISQFTLYAATKKGNRPSYTAAAKGEIAQPLCNKFTELIEKLSGKKVETGVFGADMKVELCNDGPVTIIIDSKNRF